MSSSFTFSVHVQDDLPLRSYSEVQPLLTCCTFPSVGQLALQNWFIRAATLPKDIFSFSRSSYAKYFLYSSQSAFWRIIVVFWHIGDLLARNPQLQITFIYKKNLPRYKIKLKTDRKTHYSSACLLDDSLWFQNFPSTWWILIFWWTVTLHFPTWPGSRFVSPHLHVEWNRKI